MADREIHLDVYTHADRRSMQDSANDIQREYQKIGQNSMRSQLADWKAGSIR